MCPAKKVSPTVKGSASDCRARSPASTRPQDRALQGRRGKTWPSSIDMADPSRSWSRTSRLLGIRTAVRQGALGGYLDHPGDIWPRLELRRIAHAFHARFLNDRQPVIRARQASGFSARATFGPLPHRTPGVLPSARAANQNRGHDEWVRASEEKDCTVPTPSSTSDSIFFAAHLAAVAGRNRAQVPVRVQGRPILYWACFVPSN